MQKSNVVAYINSPYINVKLPLPAIYELSGNACKLYSLMRFRMVLSIDGEKYYDFKNGYYYIIYPNKELNAIAHLKKNAFYNAINELKQKGYIKKTSTKRQSIIRLPKAEQYYVPRYDLKPRKISLNNKLNNPYIKPYSLNNKPQGLNNKPRNRTNINNQYDNQNYNSIYINNAENKFSGVIENKHKSLGLSINSLKAISGFSKNYKEFSSIIDKLFTVTSYKHNNKLNRYKKDGLFISEKLRNFKTSPYFTSNDFINDLSGVFGQIDSNTKNNHKKPNRKHYGGYFVSMMTNYMVDYLEHNKYVKKSTKSYNGNGHKPIKQQISSKYDKELLESKTDKLHPTGKKLKQNCKKGLKKIGFGNPVDMKTGQKINNKKDKNKPSKDHKKPKKQKSDSIDRTYYGYFDIKKNQGHITKTIVHQLNPYASMPIANKDIYTIIKSKLPNDDLVLTNNHFYDSNNNYTLGDLRKDMKDYNFKNSSINKKLMNDINNLVSQDEQLA